MNPKSFSTACPGAVMLSRLPQARPMITVTLDAKWTSESLRYVLTTGECFPISYQDVAFNTVKDNFGNQAVGDHCWHPDFVVELARVLNFDLDPIAHTMLIGRWAEMKNIEFPHNKPDHSERDE